jgi:hypothetical protein
MDPLTLQIMRGARTPIEYIGFAASGQDAGSNTNCTVTMSASFKSGDLLVYCATQSQSGTTGSVSNPTGWTSALSSQGRRVGWIIYDGTTSSYTWTSTISANGQGCIVACFRNAYFDTAGTISNTAQNPAAPSITINENNSVQILCGSNIASTTVTFSNSDYTQIEDMAENGTLYTDEIALAMFYKTNVNAGSTGTVTVNSTATLSSSRANQFSLRPR